MPVWTEEETEEWLEMETRRLLMPDGSAKLHTAMRVAWAWFDNLIAHEHFTSESLTALVVEVAKEKGQDFDLVFTSCIGYAELEFSRLRAKWAEQEAQLEKQFGPGVSLAKIEALERLTELGPDETAKG